MRHRIRPEEAELGMYVRSFGGSWFGHPFWRAKFTLKTPQDVEQVRESGVPYIVIDDERGRGLHSATPAVAKAEPSVAPPVRKQSAVRRSMGWDEADKARESADRQRARAIVARSLAILRDAFADVRLGRAVRVKAVAALVEDIVETVERSPRQLLEVIRLKQKHEYTYMHSLAVCTLMVNAARHMDKTEEETREYGFAGLLHDLGKMGVSEKILNKEGKLTEAEFLEIKNHALIGYQLLSQSPNMPQAALDVCRHHHEKMDGSGYPFGLPAEAISMVARLGAICDVYDALTSERVYKDAWSPIQALEAMWSWEGHFDRALLFSFMQSIGMFPPDMLVQLRSNRLALVLENKRRNTRPRVLAFYDSRNREFISPEEIVIQDNLANDSIVAAAQPQDWGFDAWDELVERLKRRDRTLLAA